MNKPRILVIAPDLPFPIRAGGQMRVASMVQALSCFATVHVACIAPCVPPETVHWCEGLGVTIQHFRREPRTLMRRILGKLKLVFCLDNLLWFPEEQAFFDQEIISFQPDMLWLETPYQVKYALGHRDVLPVLVDYWGLSEGCYRDFFFAKGLARLRYWVYWRAAAHAERKYVAKFQHVASVSEHLNTQLERWAPQAQFYAIPNGIVKDVTREYGSEVMNTLVMTGDFSFGPNVDAALWFVEKIFPTIRAQVPAVELRLVGRTPSAEVRELALEPGVVVTGFVDDVMAEIARASVYVLPLRMGSGIRSKLFDVFPLAKPLVLTSVGAEGLELVSGENCWITDDPEGFAKACIRLLLDGGERVRVGKKLRRLATEVYTQENVGHLVEQCVFSVLEK